MRAAAFPFFPLVGVARRVIAEDWLVCRWASARAIVKENIEPMQHERSQGLASASYLHLGIDI
jgi:hypothetical protein